mgnify:CR=1 FL=1
MRNLEIGDEVRVFTQVGLMKAPKWLRGTFLDEVPNDQAMVEVSNNKLIADIRRVKKYRKVGSIDEFVSKYWKDLKSIISISIPKLLGPNHPQIEINDEDNIISVYNGAISIAPELIDRETFLEFLNTPSWVVSIAVPTGGGAWEPPDVDICAVGDRPHVVNAAELFVETIWKESNKSFWESAAEHYDYEQDQNLI